MKPGSRCMCMVLSSLPCRKVFDTSSCQIDQVNCWLLDNGRESIKKLYTLSLMKTFGKESTLMSRNGTIYIMLNHIHPLTTNNVNALNSSSMALIQIAPFDAWINFFGSVIIGCKEKAVKGERKKMMMCCD